MPDAVTGGIFGLLAAGLGAVLAYYLGERKAQAERDDAAKIRHEEQLRHTRAMASILLAEIASLLQDCTVASRSHWPTGDAGFAERRRELRSRSANLRAQLYQLVS